MSTRGWVGAVAYGTALGCTVAVMARAIGHVPVPLWLAAQLLGALVVMRLAGRWGGR